MIMDLAMGLALANGMLVDVLLQQLGLATGPSRMQRHMVQMWTQPKAQNQALWSKATLTNS